MIGKDCVCRFAVNTQLKSAPVRFPLQLKFDTIFLCIPFHIVASVQADCTTEIPRKLVVSTVCGRLACCDTVSAGIGFQTSEPQNQSNTIEKNTTGLLFSSNPPDENMKRVFT